MPFLTVVMLFVHIIIWEHQLGCWFFLMLQRPSSRVLSSSVWPKLAFGEVDSYSDPFLQSIYVLAGVMMNLVCSSLILTLHILRSYAFLNHNQEQARFHLSCWNNRQAQNLIGLQVYIDAVIFLFVVELFVSSVFLHSYSCKISHLQCFPLI